MRTLRYVLGALVTAITLGACSVWQNASRKYLEKSSYDFAGLKLHEKMIGCAAPNDDASWVERSNDDRARTLTREREARFELRVEPAAQTGAVACDYAFPTESERASTTDAAIALAVETAATP